MTTTPSKPTGRPSIRTPEMDSRVLRLLSEGNPFIWFDSEEARSMGLPATSTIRRWRVDDEAFDAACARACESHAEADYDRMEELERRTLLPKTDPEWLDPYAVNVVLGNTRWRMECRKPKAYGKKVQVQASVTLEALVAGSYEKPAE